MTNQRMKWDAEAAFKSLNAQGKRRQASIDDERLKTTPYTPPPNVAAWLQAQADKPKAGRDIASLMRYHEAHKKGVTDDDALRAKYGAVTCAKCGMASVGVHYCTTGQPLPSAVTKPHGKDVDTADGPWPKWLIAGAYIRRFDGPIGGCMCYYKSGRVHDDPLGGWDLWGDDILVCTHSEALRWLEQNGHKDVAAQLRGKPRGDVATGGGRVWRGACCDWAVIGERCYIGPSRRDMKGGWEDSKCDPNKMPDHWPELFGPERDAIIAECRKAVGL